MKKYCVEHNTSTPYYPASKGLAESSVENAKCQIMKIAGNGELDCNQFNREYLNFATRHAATAFL